jgi:hypothetical protein
MITSPSPHLRPCPPVLPFFIDAYVGRMRVCLHLPSQGVSHRLFEESASSIAIELGRGRYRKFQIYDVFLSFKGRDVRRGFVDHLYNALTGAGFRVLIDTHQINRGEDISASLQQAIEVSHIQIPIFSHNYAQSAWCLTEAWFVALQVLLQGKEEESAIAVTLFDILTPEQVRHPGTGTIWQHRGRYGSKEIGEWSDAVFQLCRVSGGRSKKTRIGR